MTEIMRAAGLILGCGLLGQLGSPGAIHAQRALLEIAPGTAPDAPRLMQVNDDGGLVVRAGENPGAIPASGTGYRMMWHAGKYAFRSGYTEAEWDDASVGAGSVAIGSNTLASGANSAAFGSETKATARQATAMGERTMASGIASMAMGTATTASGASSVAMGRETQATGEGSTAMGMLTVAGHNSATAMGEVTKATGQRSTALGFRSEATSHVATAIGWGTKAAGEVSTAMGSTTTASGFAATAMGYQSQAVGDRSVAMGSNARALGEGSFAYGDASSNAVVAATANMFAVRAAGGFRFRTSPNESSGCDLQAGSAAFNCTSSRLAKEDFVDLDGEGVLGKLAAMKIQRWRYRNTRDWHVGPAAEDFHAAFALGPGPTTISTVDADGISLLAAQALERRTAELRAENAELRRRLEALEAGRCTSGK